MTNPILFAIALQLLGTGAPPNTQDYRPAFPVAPPPPIANGSIFQAQNGYAPLPPGQRAALALYHLDQLGVAEIAIALDVPPGTVKTRLMHARRTLRTLFEGAPHEQD